jgi:RHS repeat-associated protein
MNAINTYDLAYRASVEVLPENSLPSTSDLPEIGRQVTTNNTQAMVSVDMPKTDDPPPYNKKDTPETTTGTTPAASTTPATSSDASRSTSIYGLYSAQGSFEGRPPAGYAKGNSETYCEGDPIDVTTGRMILSVTDAVLPGLVLERTYRSDYMWGCSFGHGWASTVDQRIVIDGERVRYLTADGSILTYPLVAEGETTLPVVGRQLPLRRLVGGGWILTFPESGRTMLFAATTDVLSLVSDITEADLRWSFIRDDVGTVTQLWSSAGATIEFTSNEGLVLALRLPTENGQLIEVYRFNYDREANLIAVVNSSGDPERYLHADGRIVRWDDRNDHWYTYVYDKDGRCVSTDGTDGFLRYQFEYTEGLTVITDSLGAVRRYKINDLYQIVAMTDPTGATVLNEWDDANRLLALTDELGRTTQYAYDDAGRPTVVTRHDGSHSTTVYDDKLRQASFTDFDGSTRIRTFDTDGRLETETDGTGTIIRSERPTQTRPETIVQAGPAAAVRNATHQIMSLTTARENNRYHYDELGRVTTIVNADGLTNFGWTPEGDLSWRENPDGTLDEWIYDAEGNLLESHSTDGLSTRYEYGPFGLLTAQIYDTGERTTYTYDTELRLTSITNPAGQTWSYTYDANGQLIEETDFDRRTQRYVYDAAGQLTEHTHATGEVTMYTYDVLGRVTERCTGEAMLTRFEYDAAGRVTAADDADSRIRIKRDPLGRVVSETVNEHTVFTSYGKQFGELTTRTRPSGIVTQWSYDQSGRPLVLQAGGQHLRLGYNKGREASRVWNTGLTLEPAATPHPATSEQVINPDAAQYTLDTQGRPITRSHAGDTWHFIWDNENRLSEVTTPSREHWQYQYDAFGRRIAKQRSAKGQIIEKTKFVWSGDLLIEQHHQIGAGKITTTAWEYHPNLTHPIAQITNGIVHAVVTDNTGIPTDIIGLDGAIVDNTIPLRYQGRYLDTETGLQYDRSRYYDPTTTQYLPKPNPTTATPPPTNKTSPSTAC